MADYLFFFGKLHYYQPFAYTFEKDAAFVDVIG